MQMRLTRGATIISLSGGYGSIIACTYLQQAAAQEDAETTETVEIVLEGSQANMLADIRLIEGWLADAEQNQAERLVHDRIFLEWDINDSSTWYRSEILRGRIERGRTFRHLRLGAVTLGIVITRKNFWEGPEAQIPLTNGNGTNNTSGLNVFNCNDGSGTSPNRRHNYVEIASAAVGGTLPAPLRLEMTNNFDSASRLNNLWIAQNIFSDPANFDHRIEGEATAQGGTTQSDSGSSGGNYRQFTWAGDTQVLIGRWVLSTAFLNRARGRWFKILARMLSSIPTDCRLQCKITFPTGVPLTPVAISQEVLINSYDTLQEIGTVQLPPWLVTASGDLAPVDLSLYARRPGGGTLNLDWMQVTPLDGYRQLVPRGYGAAYQVRIVDDGIEQSLWTDGWSPAGKTGHYTSIGEPPLLQPSRLQRIMFLQSGNTGDSNITRVLSVKAFYRPRRWSL
jgi:hypothetical protein